MICDRVAARKSGIRRASELPIWFQMNSKERSEWATEQIVNDPKTLWHSNNDINNAGYNADLIKSGKISLVYNFKWPTFTLGFEQQSEYAPMFKHYVLKSYETGIHQRQIRILDSSIKSPLKIGIPEPEPLSFNNVLFSFSFLGAGIITSLAIASVENLKKVTSAISRKKQVCMVIIFTFNIELINMC